MPVISCLCHDCGKSFFMKNEAYAPMTSNTIRRQNQLKTSVAEVDKPTADWVIENMVLQNKKTDYFR